MKEKSIDLLDRNAQYIEILNHIPEKIENSILIVDDSRLSKLEFSEVCKILEATYKYQVNKIGISNTVGFTSRSEFRFCGLIKENNSSEYLASFVVTGISDFEHVSNLIRDLNTDICVSFDTKDTKKISDFLLNLMNSLYSFDIFKSNPKKYNLRKLYVVTVEATKLQRTRLPDFDKRFNELIALIKSTNFMRDLINLPPNRESPEDFCRFVEEQSDTIEKLELEILEKQELVESQFEGLLSVASASSREPRFLVLRYYGDNASDKTIGLIGKGIIFDSGGLSLKTSTNIKNMKYDMAGAATAVSVVITAALLELPVNVVACCPLTENVIGCSGYRPDDVLTLRSGKTVEISSTDAEGRLVLADAMDYAQDVEGCTTIITIATLTGMASGFFSNLVLPFITNSDSISKKMQIASIDSCETVCELPLNNKYKKFVESKIADLYNTRNAESCETFASIMFLQEFIYDSVTWLHMDIAGTAWDEKMGSATCKNLRLLLELLR